MPTASRVQKRLFVFCDGTWQDGVNNKRPLTNVATLARCLERYSDDGFLQIVYYDGGIGNGTSRPAQLIDGATGRGISAKIRNCYSFLSHNYNFEAKEGERDQIVLVGFSRGAFAVQCLASFISETGLLPGKYLYYLRGLFTLWSHQHFKQFRIGGKSVKEELNARVKQLGGSVLRTDVEILACAVWETVSTLGLPIQFSPRPLSFVGREVPKAVEFAFQALALNERRAKFKPCIWEQLSKENPKATMKQCWFLGSHGDVGGNGDAALGAVTLIWMIGQLKSIPGARIAFDDSEIGKHLKHKFLEWDYDVKKLFRFSGERLDLSKMESSGQPASMSWYWRLLGRESRRQYLESKIPMQIHFTVRLSLGNPNSNLSCRVLKNWETTLPGDDGTVFWQHHDQKLEELGPSRKVDEDSEYDILQRWGDGVYNGLRTERTDFATRVLIIRKRPKSLEARRGKMKELEEPGELQERDNNTEQVAEPDPELSSYISKLGLKAALEGDGLAPTVVYPPRP